MQNIPDLLGLPFTQLNWIEADPEYFIFQNIKKICFGKGFYVGCYPVTQEFYQKIMEETPSYFKGKHRPVEQVSWEDTQIFLKN